MSILIKNVYLDGDIKDIVIEKNIITKIGKSIDGGQGMRFIDGRNRAAIPGFINTHTHSAMTLHRGFGDDEPLMTWLKEYIWPVEEKMTEHDVYIGSKLACVEMIKSGTTGFLDMYMHPLMTAKAVEEMGLRAVLSYTLFDQGNEQRARLDRENSLLYLQKFEKMSDRIQFSLGPHAIYTVSGSQLQFCHSFAEEHDVLIHLHLSETKGEVDDCVKKYGMTPVRYLEKLGVLSERLVLAHVVWVDEEEMDILAKYNVKVVHNPASNMKLASGYRFMYDEMKKRGITVGLGTDGCSSSNNLDMTEAMKLSSLLGKVWRGDPTAVNAKDIFHTATKAGADIIRINAGEIKEGKLADLSLIRIDIAEMTPMTDLISNIVYSANGSVVDTVIVDGNILMENRVLPQEEKIIEEVAMRAESLIPKK